MRFNKKQAYEHIARKNQFGEKDIIEKFMVIDILRKEFGLFGLTGEILMIDSESCRCPDILVKSKPLIVLELDGFVHGNGEQISKRDRDVERDKDYGRIGAKLVIINKEETNGYETDKVIRVLEDNGLKRK